MPINVVAFPLLAVVLLAVYVVVKLTTIVNSLLATTSRRRPPPLSDHFVNNRFVSQSNTVSKTLS